MAMAKMNARENLLSLLRRQGYDRVPVEFSLCPGLQKTFREKIGEEDYREYFHFANRNVRGLQDKSFDQAFFKKYYDNLHPQATIDRYGVAHEPGSEAAKHMTYMRNPLANMDSLEEMKEYPFPVLDLSAHAQQIEDVKNARERGLASVGNMQCTIWETAWYMRGMENLMVDMMMEDEKAEFLLDWVMEDACTRAEAFARADVDILYLGDDIGMQNSIMMGEDLYRTWLKPRLKTVIDRARAIKPDIIVFYHSCGFITPFIQDLIDVGVDVLNPVQPECMNFEEIHAAFGDRLSFHGTIGTQSTMPFGTPDEVRREVFRNLEIAGDKGGLFCTPTHLLEPEVPWENIEAYVKACEDFK